MSQNLMEALGKEEKLLWSGKTEDFKTLDSTTKPGYVRKCIITVVLSAILLIVYTLYVDFSI